MECDPVTKGELTLFETFAIFSDRICSHGVWAMAAAATNISTDIRQAIRVILLRSSSSSTRRLRRRRES